ncbi:hypothetical protein RHOFW510R12_04345 [Rhodanobacter sp. FW510-R12]|uniref:hypothetical protein n=1 Tax=unclassified Rhodanobacter TaxID=2621553 RepID=UPI0007AA1DBB|nr:MULTISPECIES: hypothetical protein [unclassified Rhodanobacter]KZC15693.1 hypothetical protein RHOFW104R8_03565 [Rhodanobacter sp. FW104-R8]KZC28951.1 hypothetical protein RhoFW510T8_09040 [Rhodanobacter sp. FW510-T8]KZC30485.1 hypothetical protein RhoFW510R10_02110 [Rhodanobacter sp. FW510-R10]
MTRFSILLTRVTAALMLGSLLVLAGCHRGSTRDAVGTASMKGQFDATLQAYKDGQFLLDGAVLSALDVGSHFAYLKDQGKLPKTVLLVPSDDSKIRKRHLEYLARMQMDYGFTAYYDDGGTLTKINPVETKARALEDHHAPAALPDSQKGKDASSGGFDPQHQY